MNFNTPKCTFSRPKTNSTGKVIEKTLIFIRKCRFCTKNHQKVVTTFYTTVEVIEWIRLEISQIPSNMTQKYVKMSKLREIFKTPMDNGALFFQKKVTMWVLRLITGQKYCHILHPSKKCSVSRRNIGHKKVILSLSITFYHVIEWLFFKSNGQILLYLGRKTALSPKKRSLSP